MKILLWSDVHCHLHRAFARYESGMNSRLLDGLRVIDQASEVAKSCDHSIFLGDLFHSAPVPAPVFNEVYDRIKKFGCPLFMLAGNHDLRSQYYTGDQRDIPFLKFLDFSHVGVAEVSQGTSGGVGDVSVFAFNHRRNEDAAKLVSEAKPHDLLVMHQEVFGSTNDAGHSFLGGVGAEGNIGLLSKFKWVFSGHIHRPQVILEQRVETSIEKFG